MIESFCQGFLRKIREHKDTFERRILGGSLPSLEEYKFLVGKVKGIEQCEEALKEHFNTFYETKSVEEVGRNDPNIKRHEFY